MSLASMRKDGSLLVMKLLSPILVWKLMAIIIWLKEENGQNEVMVHNFTGIKEKSDDHFYYVAFYGGG